MIEQWLLLFFPIYWVNKFGLVIIGEWKIVLDYCLNMTIINWSINLSAINWYIFFYLLNLLFILMILLNTFFIFFLNGICFSISLFAGRIVIFFFGYFIILFEYLLLPRLPQIEIWYRFMYFTYLVEMSFKAIFLNLGNALLDRII